MTYSLNPSGDPRILIPSSHQQKILVVSRTFYPKEGGIEEYIYHRCLQDPEQVLVLSAAIQNDRTFDQTQKFPIYRWPVPMGLRQGTIMALFRQLFYMIASVIHGFKIYRSHPYQVLEWGHGYDFPSLLLLSYLLPVPCVMYLHGNDLLCPLKNPIFKTLFQWTLNRLQKVVCNSSYTRDCLLAEFKCTAPIYVINPSLRPEKFGNHESVQQTVRERRQISEDAVVLLSVGRLVKRKGFDRVIDQLPFLLANGVDVHYLICGRGAMEAELRAQAQQLGVTDRVHFIGYVPDDHLADYYKACDIFVLLTYFSQAEASIEGFGIVYLEATYFGKPILATKVGGVVDSVKEGINGLLVNPEASAQEVGQILLQLCCDRALREYLGQNGQQISKFSIPHRTIYQDFTRGSYANH